ncbi:hypothetical protein [Pseudomonas yamanorum]|uniref:hypothetical protein n=1 Tax=Pseudomonas yamanorum TaxID=515393 RepID=UPI003F752666
MPVYRKRLFSPLETLSLSMGQALRTDRSCQQAVDNLAIKQLQAGLQPCCTHAGGYCKARQHLPVEMVSSLVRRSSHLINAHYAGTQLWMGRPVRLVDGTTTSASCA